MRHYGDKGAALGTEALMRRVSLAGREGGQGEQLES